MSNSRNQALKVFRKTNPLLAVAVGIALSLILMCIGDHEIWLDEAHHFLLAKNATSVSDLISAMKYEGHPPLWNVVIKLLQIETVGQLQVLSGLIMLVAALVIVLFAPFSSITRIAWVCSYFFLFEYAFIARNYGLSVLFILSAVVIYTYNNRALIPVALLLGLASLTHVYAGVLSFVLMVFFIWEASRHSVHRVSLIIPVILFTLLLAIGIYCSRPQTDHFVFEYHSAEVHSLRRLGSMFLIPFKAFFHVPQFTSTQWWNSNLLLPDWKPAAVMVGTLGWLFPFFYLFGGKRKYVILFAIMLFALVVAIGLTPMPISLRHCGFVIVAFLVCMWLSRADSQSRIESGKWNTIRNVALNLFFVVQIGAAGIAIYRERNTTFSHAKSVADYIIQKGISANQLCVYPQYAGPAVAAYIGAPIFYAERNTYGTFASWMLNEFYIDEETMWERCLQQQKNMNRPMFIATAVPLSLEHEKFELFELIRFSGAAVQAENYVVYEIKPK